jgi:DNA-binding CsgD family transcriptional regulator/tetratricopeptide (TPR) repeat protein
VRGPGETYDFAHAIVRHTLYDELSPSRRARLHRRIAESMEVLEPGSGARHVAEIAAQYHASASLPGAERGVRYEVLAAEQARARYAVDQAVALLRLARDMADQSAPSERADVLQRLAVAEAEAVMLEDAPRTAEAALDAIVATEPDPGPAIRFTEMVARLLKDGGAPFAIWGPLVERGLALVGDRRDLEWARLSLLQDRYDTAVSGSIRVARWLGHDQEAVRVAQRQGDEGDFARSLDPLTWRDQTETQEALQHVRTWSTLTAVLRGLNLVGRDLFYRHGQFHTAVERYRELLSAANRFGSIPDQAEACAQLAAILMYLGEFAGAVENLAQAQQLVARLGVGHRLHFVVEVSLPAQLAYYTSGNWSLLAERAQRAMTDPEGQHGPLGLMAVGIAALVYLRAGEPQNALRLIDDLTPIVVNLEPKFYVQNHVIPVAAAVIWELAATRLAEPFLRLARALVQARVAPGALVGHELTAARMAALTGDWAKAARWFARARVVEETCGRRPARALVDSDEAVALLRRRQADTVRIDILLTEARNRFQSLGMDDWILRVEALTGSKVDGSFVGPAGLTGREMEVLKLVAAGHTSKEIAAQLTISLATVQRHVANIYVKIAARGRADATAFAVRNGILPLGPGGPA